MNNTPESQIPATSPLEVALLPCPFCGSADTYVAELGGWESFCKSCGTNGPALETKRDKVIAAWNRRTSPPSSPVVAPVGLSDKYCDACRKAKGVDPTAYVTVPQRLDELIAQHGSLRAAARVLDFDAGYLSRLHSGESFNPGETILRRLGLREITTYERTK